MSDKDNIAIKVSHVSKSFKLPHEKNTSVKSFIVNPFKKRTFEKQEVLKDIDFEIKKGEFFGIVGRNGSGKSTLLKLISGIYSPNKGHIQINGKLTPFIELGVGFNPELTGRENVFLNGALLGFNRKEMSAMYDEIVEFAELERFMDQKLKNYSSGMQVRLAFSIAIRAQSDILVLDEVLAVGDESFQRKCYGYFAQLKRDKKTVILVTHSMDNITRFCDKAIMMDGGKISASGSVKLVAESYTKLNSETLESSSSNISKIEKPTKNSYAETTLTLKDGNNVTKKAFYNKEEDKTLNIKMTIQIKKDINKETFCSILIKNVNGEVVTRVASEDAEGGIDIMNRPRRGQKVIMESAIQNIFGEGEYFVAVSFKSVDRSESYIESEDKLSFTIAGLGMNGFALRPNNITKVNRKLS